MKSAIMSGKEFAEHAKAHQGVFLQGNITYDPNRSDIILFGPRLPFGPCPAQPLPGDKVTIVRLGSAHSCGDHKQAWDADIILALPDPANHEAVTLANLLASVSYVHSLQAKESCDCGSVAHSNSRRREPRTLYVAECTFIVSGGSSVSFSGEGVSPAAARSDAERNCILEGYTIIGYGGCTVTP